MALVRSGCIRFCCVDTVDGPCFVGTTAALPRYALIVSIHHGLDLCLLHCDHWLKDC